MWDMVIYIVSDVIYNLLKGCLGTLIHLKSSPMPLQDVILHKKALQIFFFNLER